MSEIDTTTEVLRQAFPNECDAVGPAIVERLVQHQAVIEPTEGRRMDLIRIIEVLAAAVTLINELPLLFDRLANTLQRKPTQDELLSVVPAEMLSANHLTRDQQERAAAAFVRQKS